jgi:hypothetical protein
MVSVVIPPDVSASLKRVRLPGREGGRSSRAVERARVGAVAEFQDRRRPQSAQAGPWDLDGSALRLAGVEDFDAGVDEFPGVARGQRGGVRATDRGDLCVEGVDGASAALPCRCDVAVQPAAAASKGRIWPGKAPSTSSASYRRSMARRPSGSRARPKRTSATVMAVVTRDPSSAGRARSRPSGPGRGA